MRIKYEYGSSHFVDVKEENKQYFAKWDFEDENGYTLINVEEKIYTYPNETKEKTFLFAGVRWWFRHAI